VRDLLSILIALLAFCQREPPVDSAPTDTGVTCECPGLELLDCQPEYPSDDYVVWCETCIQFILDECPDVDVVF